VSSGTVKKLVPDDTGELLKSMIEDEREELIVEERKKVTLGGGCYNLPRLLRRLRVRATQTWP
jgi:hypothetical protein